MRGVSVVCALEQGGDFVFLVDATQPVIAVAHLVDGARRTFVVIVEIGLNLQKQSCEDLRVARVCQPQRNQQILIGASKRNFFRDEMHLLGGPARDRPAIRTK